MFYAHSAPRSAPDGRDRSTWEPLAEHLRDVAEAAAGFASPFRAEEEARAAGLLHDLGKYSESFNLRLEGKERGLDHWSAGASAALHRYQARGIPIALAIEGHHIGLQAGDPASIPLLDLASRARNLPPGQRLTETNAAILDRCLAEDGLTLPATFDSVWPAPEAGKRFDPFSLPAAAAELDVRMLFSALVDADFLETEAHFGRGPDGAKRRRPKGLALSSAEALAHLEAHLARLAEASPAHERVNELRRELLADCLAAAGRPPGLFTLTAPTGTGKTLAMLAFALKHAAAHGLRRVVVALPFLSILEQTARVYRELFEPLFGTGYVLEHHSLATRRPEAAGQAGDDVGEGERQRRWLTENWDAPLVVTTSVQLLESLHASSPRPCRKLHRLAGSVILLDEVQTLPVSLALPTLATLSHLASRYGSTVVFATATQPAFERFHEGVRSLAASGWRPREIVRDAPSLFARSGRTRVRLELSVPRPWDSLADELGGMPQALAIVNLKRHARTLAEALAARGAEGLFHLSTNLCPAHRDVVLAEVRRRLASGQPCRLVATQCIEAGVDVDFPYVFRALAPLDSLAQAAGRCNRNGLMPEKGEVVVFRPPREREREWLYPNPAYEQAADVAYRILCDRGLDRTEDLADPSLFRAYYEDLYTVIGAETQAERNPKLHQALEARHFARVAELYRLIAEDTVRVVVPYDEEAWHSLRRELVEAGRLTVGWIRRAQVHAISLYRWKKDDPVTNILEPAPLVGEEKSDEWFVCLDPDAYDRERFGFVGGGMGLWIA